MRRRLGNPLPPIKPIEEAQTALMGALGWEALPSKKEIRKATKRLVNLARIRAGLSTLSKKASDPNPPKERTLKATYATYQYLWRNRRSDLLDLVLMGGSLTCKISKAEILSFYKKLWGTEREYRGLEQFGGLPLADNLPFRYPISGNEVLKTLKRMSPKSCPGPDGIRRSHLTMVRPPPLNEACVHYPDPKSCDKKAVPLLKNWRPITFGSVVYRTFMGILAERMGESCPPHPRQRGFIQGPGCAENISVIKSLHTAAKRRSRSLGAVFIDLARAFDSVDHRLIQEVLNAKGLNQLVVKLIGSAYTNSSTQLKTSIGFTTPIRLKSGVKQGDPLSLILFNLCLDPLMYTLEKEVVGAQFGRDLAIPSIVYADDLVILGESHSELQKALDLLTSIWKVLASQPTPPNATLSSYPHRLAVSSSITVLPSRCKVTP
ncbi:hypothetical protein WMY93_029853 [Mugilogobius chulae]|uniref:Reverse transcriptase domain-containing protein n=1 Tax=Mugilogobius chulae TaxID=88201 RepID=A0AAW0MU32_9GOBI